MFSAYYAHPSLSHYIFVLHSRKTQILGLGFRVFPFHSPLLRKSWLFSFPPLIKMLQFSGLILFKLRFITDLCVLEYKNYF